MDVFEPALVAVLRALDPFLLYSSVGPWPQHFVPQVADAVARFFDLSSKSDHACPDAMCSSFALLA